MNETLRQARVMVTRSRSQRSRLANMIRDRGGVAAEVPVVATRERPAESWSDSMLAGDYDDVVFRSATAVRICAARLTSAQRDQLGSARISVVGSATGDAVRELLGFEPALMPDRYDAASLLALMTRSPVAGRRIVVPRACEGSWVLENGLRDLGAKVDAPILYDVVPDPGARERMNKAMPVDIVTVASSLTGQFLMRAAEAGGLHEWVRNVPIASIGPKTTESLVASGLKVVVQADQATLPKLVEAVVFWWSA